jgi:hypothetical protein
MIATRLRAIAPLPAQALLKSYWWRASYSYSDWRYRRNQLAVRAEAPTDAEEYLVRRNPRLIELQKRYTDKAIFTHTFWKDWSQHLDLRHFRSDGQYITQSGARNPEAQYLGTTAFAEAVDDWRLLESLEEDGLFGCHAYRFAENLVVSRDLLDSIFEITFLRRSIGLGRTDEFRVLDLGAGYGRFVHRLLNTFPNASATAVDGVAESTFLCEFYMAFRGLSARATTLPLHQLENLSGQRADICVNIHSWSECTRATVKFWVRLIADLGIRDLLVIPHSSEFLTKEKDGSRDTFLPEITAAGYRLARKSHKFEGSEALKNNGIAPAWYHLFHSG